MNIEEKAKAYDEAIKRVENIKTGKCKTTFMFTEGLFEHIFPEIKESEDEKIRKEIAELVMLPTWKTETEFYRRKELIAWLEKQGEQKPAWSEEDEEMYKEVLTDIIYAKNDLKAKECHGLSKRAMEAFNWFSNRYKSLRPQNWTKEDKERYISCLQRLGTGNPEQPETINSKWFKEHVYPQSTWKPSDEQMENLNRAFNGGTFQTSLLMELYQDLKKLRNG